MKANERTDNPTDSTTNVYINNLPAGFTENHLYQLCSAFGPIVSVRMMGRDTGTYYGFVLYVSIFCFFPFGKQL